MSNKISIPYILKRKVLERDKSTCQKCGFSGKIRELEIHHLKPRVSNGKDEVENLITLCSICHYYAPDSEENFKIYLSEKIDGSILETFRKIQKTISRLSKKGMDKKARDGNIVTRAPFGYKLEEKKLIPAEHSYQVQEIFQEFLNTNISLTQLSKKFGFSVNGLKKILKNQTYLGKIKFDGQIHQGHHQPLLSSTLFNHVQNKLEKIEYKKK